MKVTPQGITYYLEAAVENYGNEKLLINKQMIKTGIEDIPSLYGLKSAIKEKQSETEFLNDLKVRQAYVQNDAQFHSANPIISDSYQIINTPDGKKSKDDTTSDDREYMAAVERGDMKTAQRMVDKAAERAFANSKVRDEDGKLLKVYHGSGAG